MRDYACPVSAGTIYRVNPAGGYFSTPFNGLSDGKTPNFLIEANDGAFYGTASFFGMPIANGTLFRIDAAGNFTSLHTFQQGLDGANPNSVMTLFGTGLLTAPASVTVPAR